MGNVRIAGALLALGMVLTAAVADDDLTPLCDEFSSSATLSNWRRLTVDEGWNNEQFERLYINEDEGGWLVMMPHTSVWYQDYRGPLIHQRITGDFIVTTRLAVRNRENAGAPRSSFSLCGLMLRIPRNITPQTWQPGGENYVFITFGTGNQPGRFQFENKTTVNSRSQLRLIDAPGGRADLRIARIGPHIIELRREPGSNWRIHQRYRRDDFPAEIQAGLVAYTDYPTCSRIDVRQHNTSVIRQGRPDLLAAADFMHYRRPEIPADLANGDFSNPAAVTDARLLAFLGEAADRVAAN